MKIWSQQANNREDRACIVEQEKVFRRTYSDNERY
jgi:hypothetical protein